MLQVGIVGIGFMGMIHFLAYQRVPGVRVAAIYSRDARKLAGDWRSIKGNFGPPGRKMDLTGIRRYEKLDDMRCRGECVLARTAVFDVPRRQVRRRSGADFIQRISWRYFA